MTKIEWTEATTGRHDQTAYQRSRVRWTQRIWYGSQIGLFDQKTARVRGREFEIIAARHAFPTLGLSGVTDLAAIVSSAPFDFIATLNGRRVVIDVSAKWQKRVDTKAPLAKALGFELYLLLISPRDRRQFYFTPVRSDAKSVRVPFDVLRRMAVDFKEPSHGRH